jgi:uncharacterized protein YeaO (DUF488 family)
MIQIKRAYEPPDPSDGCRILVDRLWPRGLSKEKAQIDLWLKEIAPSAELRKWFGHDPLKWTEFKKRYATELNNNPDSLSVIRERMGDEKITLVYGAKDEEHNNAAALKEILDLLQKSKG